MGLPGTSTGYRRKVPERDAPVYSEKLPRGEAGIGRGATCAFGRSALAYRKKRADIECFDINHNNRSSSLGPGVEAGDRFAGRRRRSATPPTRSDICGDIQKQGIGRRPVSATSGGPRERIETSHFHNNKTPSYSRTSSIVNCGSQRIHNNVAASATPPYCVTDPFHSSWKKRRSGVRRRRSQSRSRATSATYDRAYDIFETPSRSPAQPSNKTEWAGTTYYNTLSEHSRTNILTPPSRSPSNSVRSSKGWFESNTRNRSGERKTIARWVAKTSTATRQESDWCGPIVKEEPASSFPQSYLAPQRSCSSEIWATPPTAPAGSLLTTGNGGVAAVTTISSKPAQLPDSANQIGVQNKSPIHGDSEHRGATKAVNIMLTNYSALNVAGPATTAYIVVPSASPGSEQTVPAHAERGSNHILYFTGICLFAAYTFSILAYGIAGAGLFTLSLLPIVVVLWLCWIWHSQQITVPLMLELFWSGAVLSIGTASILEMVSQFQTRQVWRCQTEAPTLSCDIKFVLVVVIGVGFVEEFSKLLPISRIRVCCYCHSDFSIVPLWFQCSAKDLPARYGWWFRLIRYPRVFALAGLFSAAGFAGIENIKYVFSEGASLTSWGTSLWRAVLAIPFHLTCTTYAAAVLAHHIYRRKADPETADPCTLRPLVPLLDSSDRISADCAAPNPHDLAPRQTHVVDEERGNENQIHVINHSTPPEEEEERLRSSDIFDIVEPTLWTFVKALFLPSLLHGLYDSGLFLAVQFVSHAGYNDDDSDVGDRLTYLLARLSALPLKHVASSERIGRLLQTAVSAARDGSDASADSGNDLYGFIACGCVGISLLSYLLMLTLSVRKFFSLDKVEAVALVARAVSEHAAGEQDTSESGPNPSNRSYELVAADGITCCDRGSPSQPRTTCTMRFLTGLLNITLPAGISILPFVVNVRDARWEQKILAPDFVLDDSISMIIAGSAGFFAGASVCVLYTAPLTPPMGISPTVRKPVMRREALRFARGLAILLYVISLALSGLAPWVFHHFHLPLLAALFTSTACALACLALPNFAKVSYASALLYLPQVLWLLYTAILLSNVAGLNDVVYYQDLITPFEVT